MGRGWKICIGVVVALAVLIGVNVLLVEGETKSAEVTVPGGKLLDLPGGRLQVVEHGPRDGIPIVLLHCFTCAIDWWEEVTPKLDRTHRVIAIDLLGHGGSEKPSSGYSIPNQAEVVAQALRRLRVRNAEVVGHSLGGSVATALAEAAPRIVNRLVLIDQAPDNDNFGPGLPLTATLTLLPVLGPALWRVTPDFAVKDGLGAAFAPGYDVPDRFVTDLRRMTYTSYDESAAAEDDYTGAIPLNHRIAATSIPLLAIFGAEDQIYDSKKALAAYARIPGSQTILVPGAGHSPNVEKPAETARLILGFAKSPRQGVGSARRDATERGPTPQQSSASAPLNRASGVRSATGDQ
jgi:pimeloyl-ACP methyl ester carboxylesterase